MAERSISKNRAKIRLHYFLALILLVHCAFYLIYWFAVGNFRFSVDQFLVDLTTLVLPYTTILMVLSAVLGVWSLFRFIGFRLAIGKDDWTPNWVNWLFFGVWVLFLAVFYVSFVLIIQQNPAQRGVITHLLNLVRLIGDVFLFLLAAVWLRRLILFLRHRMFTAKHQWPWTVLIVLTLITLVGLWLVPAIFPPNWAYQGSLPAKPTLIAHRGASMLAPENTLAAAALAAEHEAFGFETDVRISLDGVPFLMHDDSLERTTNIAEVFPDRVLDDASNFTIDELKSLNAGLWFIQKDPYGTIDSGFVSQKQLGINQGERIPTLEEALEMVENEGMVILFDMRYPPEDHPYYEEFFQIVFELCRESGLNEDIWFLIDRERLPELIEEAPQMTRVVGVASTDLPASQELLNLGYQIVNVDTGISTQAIKAYREKGLGVNVYTVDEEWLFSQFWLSGVTSVTTNSVHTLSKLDRPWINLPYSRYMIFWGLFGIVVAIWLASSQPRRDSTAPQGMETPNLLDFALEEEKPAVSNPQREDDFVEAKIESEGEDFPLSTKDSQTSSQGSSIEEDAQMQVDEGLVVPEQPSSQNDANIWVEEEKTEKEDQDSGMPA